MGMGGTAGPFCSHDSPKPQTKSVTSEMNKNRAERGRKRGMEYMRKRVVEMKFMGR